MTVRNNYAHIDERLDATVDEPKRHSCVGPILGQKNVITGTDDIDKFRHFDPTTTDVVLWDEDFSLEKTVDEAQKIFAEA